MGRADSPWDSDQQGSLLYQQHPAPKPGRDRIFPPELGCSKRGRGMDPATPFLKGREPKEGEEG